MKSYMYGVTIQKKPLQKYFHNDTIYLVCSPILTYKSVDEILWCNNSNETSSAVRSYGTIYLVCIVLTFESVDEILRCENLNETSSAVLSNATIYLVCSSNS